MTPGARAAYGPDDRVVVTGSFPDVHGVAHRALRTARRLGVRVPSLPLPGQDCW
ncbi:hypothetical protein AB0G55_19025 [Streptomyces toyocaensis]|uniref:hypothetical protein n=1 Tax=Streptomyces toyocaensis TaxID=55952 RepID=UPI000A927995|nr:hypothetical protein [Streptomyces toyocaensis]